MWHKFITGFNAGLKKARAQERPERITLTVSGTSALVGVVAIFSGHIFLGLLILALGVFIFMQDTTLGRATFKSDVPLAYVEIPGRPYAKAGRPETYGERVLEVTGATDGSVVVGRLVPLGKTTDLRCRVQIGPSTEVFMVRGASGVTTRKKRGVQDARLPLLA